MPNVSLGQCGGCVSNNSNAYWRGTSLDITQISKKKDLDHKKRKLITNDTAEEPSSVIARGKTEVMRIYLCVTDALKTVSPTTINKINVKTPS